MPYVPYTSKYPSMSQEKYTTSVRTAFAYIYVVRHVILQGAIMPQCTGAPLTRRGKQGRGGTGADGAQFAPASQHNEHTITRTCEHKCKHAPSASKIYCMHNCTWCRQNAALSNSSQSLQKSNFPIWHNWNVACLVSNIQSTPIDFAKEYLFVIWTLQLSNCDMDPTIRQLDQAWLVTTSWLCQSMCWLVNCSELLEFMWRSAERCASPVCNQTPSTLRALASCWPRAAHFAVQKASSILLLQPLVSCRLPYLSETLPLRPQHRWHGWHTR